MVISKKRIIFQGFRGSNIFQGGGGGPTLSRGGGGGGGGGEGGGGGFQVLISIETHITCDFPGEGVRNHYPPSESAHDCL